MLKLWGAREMVNRKLLMTGFCAMILGAVLGAQILALLLQRTELQYTDKVYFPDQRHTQPIVVSSFEAWHLYRKYGNVWQRPTTRLPDSEFALAIAFGVIGMVLVVMDILRRTLTRDMVRDGLRQVPLHKVLAGAAACTLAVSAIWLGVNAYRIQPTLEMNAHLRSHGYDMPRWWQVVRLGMFQVPLVLVVSGLLCLAMRRAIRETAGVTVEAP